VALFFISLAEQDQFQAHPKSASFATSPNGLSGLVFNSTCEHTIVKDSQEVRCKQARLLSAAAGHNIK
jgi:hypothetical protein